jgi:hypothetical protein
LVISLTAKPSMITTTQGTEPSKSKNHSGISESDIKKMSPFERMILRPVSKVTVEGPEGDAIRRDFGEKFLGILSDANLILLPIFALLFKMLYVRRSRYYVEHLVFALHYYAFFSLSTTAIILFSKIPPIHIPSKHVGLEIGWILNIPVFIWMLAYLPVAMFINYRQGLIKTLIKCWIFCSIYVVVIGFVLLGMVFFTLTELPTPSTPVPAISNDTHPQAALKQPSPPR